MKVETECPRDGCPSTRPPPGVVCLDASSSGPKLPGDIQNALDRIGRYVYASRSIEEVLDFIWETTSGLIPRDRIGLSFIEDDGSIVSRYAKAEYDELHLEVGYAVPPSETRLMSLMSCGRVRIIEDLREYLKHRPGSESTELLIREGVRTSVTLPLEVGDRQVGFMFLSSRKPGVYKESHARFLFEVRERISQALEKAWIIRRLEDANSNYLHMLGFVAHELKSPLAGLMSRGIIYLEGMHGEVQKGAAETIRGMIRTAGYLTDMVNNYLDLARLENGELRYSPKPDVPFFKEVYAYARDSVSAHAARRETQIVLDRPKHDVTLRCDPQLLVIAMVNLLDNAVKYGNDGQSVSVSASVADNDLVIRVRNRGPGFTAEQGKGLFRRFSRLHQKGLEDTKGSGLGLYITSWIIRKHGGRIKADSQPGEWAEFSVSLPGARDGRSA